MKFKALIFAFLMMLAAPAVWAEDVYVHGYTRSNGTYVEGYHRTSPDSTINNNYSTQGNTNPYTGREGTVPRDYSSSYGASSSSSTYGQPSQTFGGNSQPLGGNQDSLFSR